MKNPPMNGHHRPKWVNIEYNSWKGTQNAITTLAELKEHLQTAIEIELSTIPPYLCALYSIKEGTNTFPTFIIRSVVIEEMLHMILAANILNAIGGKPEINTIEAVPKYPGFLFHTDKKVKLELLPFSKGALEGFLKIEKPAETDEPPKNGHYHSIGQFYEAIMNGLRNVNANKNIFTGNPDRQVRPEHYYGAGGKLIVIENIDDACRAISEIMGQGEGIDHDILDGDPGAFDQSQEVAHYFRFNEILQGRYYKAGDTSKNPPTGAEFPVDWDGVYKMEPNPKMNNYKNNTELYDLALGFNRTYMGLLDAIDHACNGFPQEIDQSVHLMYKLKEQAVDLIRIPIKGTGFNAGPSFEYVKDR
jgi:hypothetical protein